MKSPAGLATYPQPFAIGQATGFQTGPWLGGYVYVLTAPVGAAGTVTIAHTLRVSPRTVTVLGTASATYPSRVARGATWNGKQAQVVFESAQPAGTAVFLY
jgi:hypothetical protein